MLPAFSVDRSSGQALHEQVATLLRGWIDAGTLAPGSRLPPTRELAVSLGVNRGTVQRAYEALVKGGWAKARVGQGTFIRGAATAITLGPASAAAEVAPSLVTGAADEAEWDRLARFTSRSGVLSFAGGIPDSRLFPIPPFREAMLAALDEDGAALLQYAPPRGYPPFLDFLAAHLEGRGLAAGSARLLVVSGSQQGLDLITRTLLRPGDAVAVEALTYSGALALFRRLGVRLLPVPLDEEGMDMEALADLVKRERPRLVYTIPTFHNPTGRTLSLERRRRLLEICAAASVPVLEDDSDGELRFSGEELPPLAALSGGAGVIYMGTFSKLFFPGLRLGWVSADPGLIRRLEAVKKVSDLHTPPLLQAAMTRFATGPARRRLAVEVLARYRSRRDALLAALAGGMPEGSTWTRPEGGLSLMVEVAGEHDAGDLLPRGVEQGVVFAPGHLFSPEGRRSGALRLTYGSLDEDEIAEGVVRLSAAIESERDGGRRGAGRGYPLPAPPLL